MNNSTNCPPSPISAEKMRFWLEVPLDWRRPSVNGSYQLFWSDTDQYGMVYPRPSSAEIASYYDLDDYYTHADAANSQAPQSATATLMSRLRTRISWNNDNGQHINADWFAAHRGTHAQRVLDIGCGKGDILAALQQQGHTVVGTEPDPKARARAIERGLPVYDSLAESIPDELQGETFDAVLMTHVLEHTVDPLQAVRNAAKLLTSGGVFVVEVPNNASLGMKQAGAAWRWLDVPRHLNFFTPHSLRRVCELAGLQPTTTEFRGYTRQFQREWIENEQLIWDRFAQTTKPPLPRNSEWRAWQLLAQTLPVSAENKYDSVRIIAAKA